MRWHILNTDEGWDMDVASLIMSLFDGQPPFRVEAYDGSVVDAPQGSPARDVTLKILRPTGWRAFCPTPASLGWPARSWRATSRSTATSTRCSVSRFPDHETAASRHHSCPPRRGRYVGSAPHGAPGDRGATTRHAALAARDRDAVTHHYDVSNRFYEMILVPSMTYSCAAFASPEDTLEVAQVRKVDLIAKKLGLRRR